MAHPAVYIVTAAVGVLAGLFIYFAGQSPNRQRERPSESHNRYRCGNKSDSFVGNDNNCTICLETIKNDFDRTYLRCGHSYHNECIKKWNSIKDICPLCKVKTGIDI